MNHNPWLTDRRWHWRVVVLLIVLVVFAGFLAYGESLLGALAGVVMVFLVAEYVIDRIIKDDKDVPPEGKARPPATGPMPPDQDPMAPSGVVEPGVGNATSGDLEPAA